MNSQKVIFVPGHGVPEVIRSVRLIAKRESPGRLDTNPEFQPSGPEELELWQGDFYGWYAGESATRNSAPTRIPAVFVDGNLPVVAPGKSIVAVVQNCPHGWDVEFQSEFRTGHGEVVHRTVTFDDSGTARERLWGAGALSGDLSGAVTDEHSMACDPTSDSHRTGYLPRPVERLLSHLRDSIATRFHGRAERPASP